MLFISSFYGMVHGGIFDFITEPRNYEDCVLKGLRTAETKYESNLVVSACASKFAKKKSKSKKKLLPPYKPELDKFNSPKCIVYNSTGNRIRFTHIRENPCVHASSLFVCVIKSMLCVWLFGYARVRSISR